MAKRNFPEGCPLRNPLLSKIVGTKCLEGCGGSLKLTKNIVTTNVGNVFLESEEVAEKETFCGAVPIEDQLFLGEITSAEIGRRLAGNTPIQVVYERVAE